MVQGETHLISPFVRAPRTESFCFQVPSLRYDRREENARGSVFWRGVVPPRSSYRNSCSHVISQVLAREAYGFYARQLDYRSEARQSFFLVVRQ